MKVLQTSIFKRRTKKLHKNEKNALDSTIKLIMQTPTIGVEKIGDLRGVYVYKYKIKVNQYLLAYSFNLNRQEITLLAYGSHENFYRDLKR